MLLDQFLNTFLGRLTKVSGSPLRVDALPSGSPDRTSGGRSSAACLPWLLAGEGIYPVALEAATILD